MTVESNEKPREEPALPKTYLLEVDNARLSLEDTDSKSSDGSAPPITRERMIIEAVRLYKKDRANLYDPTPMDQRNYEDRITRYLDRMISQDYYIERTDGTLVPTEKIKDLYYPEENGWYTNWQGATEERLQQIGEQIEKNKN